MGTGTLGLGHVQTLIGMLLGILLGIGAAVGQTIPAESVPPPDCIAPAATMLKMVPTRFPAGSFPLAQGPEKSLAPFSSSYTRAYERYQRPEEFTLVDVVRTIDLTQSNVELVQVWGGLLRLNAFESSLLLQYGSGPFHHPSINLNGFSLSLNFGRDEGVGHPARVWRRLRETVDALLD